MPTKITADEVCRLIGIPALKGPNGIRHFALANGKTSMLHNADSGNKSAIAKHLAEHLVGPKGAIFCATDWGVWPSSEIPELFYRIRSSQGFPHQVWEVQAEKVEESEKEYYTCLLACGLYFIWGFVAINLDNGLLIHFSHDEGMDVVCADSDLEQEIMSRLPRASA